MMKQFLFSIGFLCSFFISFGQCPPGNDVVFTSQAQIDAFAVDYPNCTTITSNTFRIGPDPGVESTDITDLSPLSNIESISVVNFDIIRNNNLSSLLGLENTSISGGFIYIALNDMITDLHGLEGLELDNENFVFGILENDSLENLDGLENVTLTSSGILEIQGNLSLTSIDGLRNAIGFNNVYITNNPILSDCNVSNVCSRVLFEIAFIESEGQTGGFAIVSGNGEGCLGLSQTGQSCEECGTTQIVLSSQDLVNNFPLNYPDCTDFNYGVLIQGSDIVDISPLSEITSITGGLIINSTSLESLDGLEGLLDVDEIHMTNNPLLTDISKFEDIVIEDLEYLEITNNSQLNSCTLDVFCTYLVGGGVFTISDNGSNCDSGLDIVIACGFELNQISGSVRYDFDNTGCETGDYSASNLIITATSNSNTYSTLTDENGNYSLLVGTGEITTAIDQTSLPNIYTATPSSIIQEFGSSGDAIDANFCVGTTTMLHDVSVSLLPLQQPRPGFEARYIVSYSNQGTFIESGGITLGFDDESVFFVEAEVAPVSSTNASLTWEYDTLLPFETRSFEVTFELFTPPTLIGGEILSSGVTITAANGDEITENNISSLREIVVNSYDPNDKQVLQGAYIFEEEVGEYLDYIIRFQNTGTADAINVEVTDELSENLDWGSFRMLDASHDYRIEITNGNQVAFIFEDINLPPEELDEEGSNGFIAFQIRSNADLVLGDAIENTAYIYFDFNEPIITNTVVTTVSPPCPAAITLTSQGEINLFDEIFSDCTEIDGQLIIEGDDITDLSPLSNITSVTGNIVIRNNSNLVSLSGLNNITSTDGLFIINNDSLDDLAGLESLTSINGQLRIEGNDSLENLTGLINYSNGDVFSIINNENLTSLDGVENLSTVSSGFSLSGNEMLTDITALSNLLDPSMYVSITNNPNLSVCDIDVVCSFISNLEPSQNVVIVNNATGCNSLTEVEEECAPCPTGTIVLSSQAEVDAFIVDSPDCMDILYGLTISGNDIVDLSSLSQLASIEGDLIIENNPLLTSLNGLENLDNFISGSLIISNNPLLSSLQGLGGFGFSTQIINNDSLLNLEGLNDLSDANELLIIGNDSLQNLEGLDSYTIGHSLTIKSNTSLSSFVGLESFNAITVLSIENNPMLVDISILQNLTQIAESFEIINNDSLTSLDGLQNGNAFFGFVISDNDALTNINALTDLATPFSFIEITNNSSLSNCVISLLCDNISNTNLLTISNNAPDCNSVEEVEEQCVLSVEAEFLENNIRLYPNPTTRILNIRLPSGVELQAIEVHSVTGKTIMTTQNVTINFSSLAKGIYFARIMTSKGTITKKIVKK